MLAEVMEKGCQLGPQDDKVIPQLSQIPFLWKRTSLCRPTSHSKTKTTGRGSHITASSKATKSDTALETIKLQIMF